MWKVGGQTLEPLQYPSPRHYRAQHMTMELTAPQAPALEWLPWQHPHPALIYPEGQGGTRAPSLLVWDSLFLSASLCGICQMTTSQGFVSSKRGDGNASHQNTNPSFGQNARSLQLELPIC